MKYFASPTRAGLLYCAGPGVLRLRAADVDAAREELRAWLARHPDADASAVLYEVFVIPHPAVGSTRRARRGYRRNPTKGTALETVWRPS